MSQNLASYVELRKEKKATHQLEALADSHNTHEGSSQSPLAAISQSKQIISKVIFHPLTKTSLQIILGKIQQKERCCHFSI